VIPILSAAQQPLEMMRRKQFIVIEVCNPRSACHIVCEADCPNASDSPQLGRIFGIARSLRQIVKPQSWIADS
jgi:hypothetical protein